MKYFIFPLGSSSNDESMWKVVEGASLGGFFYDRIVGGDGSLIGVRYYIEGLVNPDNYPVLSAFCSDARFQFSIELGYVDILFKPSRSDDFRDRLFAVDVTQDFGGDHVLRHGDAMGILFDMTE